MYVVSYLAMGLPAVIAGVLVVHGGGLSTTAQEYGVAVMLLAALALLGLALQRREQEPAPARPVASLIYADGSVQPLETVDRLV
jgi:heme A synthase